MQSVYQDRLETNTGKTQKGLRYRIIRCTCVPWLGKAGFGERKLLRGADGLRGGGVLLW
jgi:hypothetical protein